MKKTLIAISLLFTQISFAEITNSNHELRHQDLIEKSITSNCGSMRDLTEVSVTSEDIVIDNGIRDINYVTVLSGLQRMDQNIFDRYTITVKSNYADMYDHSSQNWGAYNVSSVTCVME